MQSADEHRRELQTDSVLAACTFAKGVGLPCCLKTLQERIQAEFENNVVCGACTVESRVVVHWSPLSVPYAYCIAPAIDNIK